MLCFDYFVIQKSNMWNEYFDNFFDHLDPKLDLNKHFH